MASGVNVRLSKHTRAWGLGAAKYGEGSGSAQLRARCDSGVRMGMAENVGRDGVGEAK